METDGGGEAERRRRCELGRLLEAIRFSEVLEKRIPLIKQLEEFSADDLGLILQCLLASWIDSTCSGVSHCKLHRSILRVALKCSDLDITDYLGQFLTLGAKASSWCEKHLQWSVKSIHKEEDHNRLRLEVNSLSFSISTKLLDIAAKCITELEVAEEECVLNKAEDAFPTLEGMVAEPAPAHLAVEMRRPPPQEAPRRCTHCASENTRRWRRGADGPGTLCNACGQRFLKGRLLHSNSKKRRSSSKEKNSAAGDDLVAALVDALPCGVGASFDAFFDHTFPSASWEEAGPGRAEGEEELEWLSNKDAFPSIETMTPVEVEEAPALDAPRARTKGCRRRVTANAVLPRRRCTHCGTEETPQWREGPEGSGTLCNACGMVFKKNGRLLPEYRPGNRYAFSHSNKHLRAREMHSQTSAAVLPRRRCTHCGTEETPQWRGGPEGPRTLCNACGVVFKNGRLLPEYRPANSPAFSPQLHSNRHRRALEMHRQNGPTSSSSPPRYRPLSRVLIQMEEETSAAARATVGACSGEALHEPMEVQLLPVPDPERPPADSPGFSLLLRSRPNGQSEEETFAAIRATAKARRAERLAAMDN